MNINRKISKYNFNKGSVSRIKYIVIHYVGALGGAEDNCRYYGGGNRNASAHYFVGFNGEVWQCVEDANIAWHCGASSYKHAECRNANSIGIEMCVRKKNTKSMGATDKDWYFEDATVEAAAELTRYLMNKYGRWQSLEEWFTGTDGKDSEAAKVFDTTNEIIRKITRYAARISEMSNAGANRREEYHKVAVMFSKCKNIFEARRLAAVVFGIEKPLHLKGLPWRQTESINSGVFEEEPYIVTVTPRIRTYKEKAKRSGIVDRSKEKEEMRLATIQRLEEERRILKSYIQDNRLEFAKLPEIEPHVRDVFLTWLSKALENKSLQGKTEDGQVYRVEKSDTEEICILKSSDGNLQMPAYVIVFEKNE